MANGETKAAGRSNPFVMALAIFGALAIALVLLSMLSVVYIVRTLGQAGSLTGTGGETMTTLPTSNGKVIAGVKLEGQIGADTAKTVIRKLNQARKNDHAVGILLEVSSPGGSVVPSQEIYDTIKEISATKPVVAYVREMAASGAYYSLAPSSRVVANRGSLLGSIGVIMQSFEATDLVAWMRLKPMTLKTGRLKDAGSPLRTWTEEDKTYLQKLIEDTRAQFATDVKNARGLTESTLAYLSDGRVVLGPEAVKLKLADALGNRETAVDEIKGLLKLGKDEKPEVIYLEEKQGLPSLLQELLEHETKSLVDGLVAAALGRGVTSAQTPQATTP